MKKYILLLLVLCSGMGSSRLNAAGAWHTSFISIGTGGGAKFKTYWTMALGSGESADARTMARFIGQLERPAKIPTAPWNKKKAMFQLERRFNIFSEKGREFAWLVARGKTKQVKKMIEELAGTDPKTKKPLLSDEEITSIMRIGVAYRRVAIVKYLISTDSPIFERFKQWEIGIYGACVRIRALTWFTPGRMILDAVTLWQGHKAGIYLDDSLADEGWQRDMHVTNATKEQTVPYHQRVSGYLLDWGTGYYFKLFFGGALKFIR